MKGEHGVVLGMVDFGKEVTETEDGGGETGRGGEGRWLASRARHGKPQLGYLQYCA